jgi:integrase
MPGDGEERVPFSDSQIKDLLKAASLEWRGMILFGAYAGLRIGDAANLRWSSIDLSTRILTYQPAKTARRKKPSERAVRVWMHDALIGYLETLPVNDDPISFLLPSLIDQCTGGERGYSKTFSRLMEEAVVRGPAGSAKGGQGRRFNPLTFHSLRHTFISKLANLEVSSYLRKELVGHSSDAIHDRYKHLSFDLQRVTTRS